MKRIILIVALVNFCFACAMPAIPHDVKQSTESLTQKPSRGEATVVFVRASKLMSGLPLALHDGEKIIGVVKGGNCAVYSASPGKHIFDAFIKKGAGMDGRNRYMFIDADLAPNRTYYILVRPYVIYFAGVFTDLEPIRNGNEHWNNLPDWLSKCSVTEVNEKTLSWDEKMAAKNKKIRATDDEGWRRKDEERVKKAIKPQDGVKSPVMPSR